MIKNNQKVKRTKSITKKFLILFFLLIVFPITLISVSYFKKIQSNLNIELQKETSNSIHMFSQNFDNFKNSLIQIMVLVSEDDQLDNFIDETEKLSLLDKKYQTQKLLLERHLSNVASSISFERITMPVDINIVTNKDVLFSSSSAVSNFYEESFSFDEISNYNSNNYKKLFDRTEKSSLTWDFSTISRNIKGEKEFNKLTVMRKIGLNGLDETAIVMMFVDYDEIWKFLENSTEDYSWVIFDENNQVGCASDTKFSTKILQELGNKAEKAPNSTFSYTDIHHENYFIISQKMENTNWRLMEIKSTKTFDSKMKGILLTYTSEMIFILFLFGLFMFFIIKNMVGPIHFLAKKMQRADLDMRKEGEFYPVPRKSFIIDTNEDEIFMLEQSYDLMYSNINELIKNNIVIERKKKDAEMKALQAQINPHFLFNTLSTVRFAISNGNRSKAEDLLNSLIVLINHSVVNSNEFNTLSAQLENIAVYVKLISLRYDKDFFVSTQIEDSLLSFKLPKLILQPIIENSLIHGYEDMDRGEIIIKMSKNVNEITLQILDFGKGFPCDQNTKVADLKSSARNTHRKGFHGIALSNVEERLKLSYGNKASLHVQSEEGTGTTVTIKIIYIPNKEKPFIQ